jgi:hypothetical protein
MSARLILTAIESASRWRVAVVSSKGLGATGSIFLKHEFHPIICSFPAPQKAHWVSIAKTSQLMLFSEVVNLYSDNHMKSINTRHKKNEGVLMLKHEAHIVATVIYMINITCNIGGSACNKSTYG